MGSVNRFRIFLILLVLGCAAVSVNGKTEVREVVRYSPLVSEIGMVGPWRPVSESRLEPVVLDALKLDDYLFRSYSDGAEQVGLYIGYYYTAGKVGAAHDPLVCLPGQGWVVDNRREAKTGWLHQGRPIHFSTMVAEQGGQRELFLYWFQAYDETTPNTFQQKIALWKKRILNGAEDNAFVRLSIPLGNKTEAEALAVLDSFVGNFYPHFLDYILSTSLAQDPSLIGSISFHTWVYENLTLFKGLFWGSLLLLAYIYLGYPGLVLLVGFIRPRAIVKDDIFPSVSIVIAAFNEAKVIRQTIDNKLALDYPMDRLEIIVVSDGSEDGTDEIVREYADRRVRLIRQSPRGGKTSALNLAVPEASGEIIVFSDANSTYAPDALRKLVRNFADERVGYVTGKMVYSHGLSSGNGEGCSNYMRYENGLRHLETRIGSVVGVDGGIDAVRKRLFVSMNPDQLPDFVLPLKVVEQGYRVIYEPEALLCEEALEKTADEYRMRVRVSLRALWAISDMKKLLFLPGNLLFSWQLWSHKVLRYFAFVFLVTAFFANWLLLADSVAYRIIFSIQIGGYLGAFTFPLLERLGIFARLFSFPHYFAVLNCACAHAFGKFLLGKKQVVWTPRKG